MSMFFKPENSFMVTHYDKERGYGYGWFSTENEAIEYATE